MENLKLTSIRLHKSALFRADNLVKHAGYWRASDMLRLAIWVGFKILKPGVIQKLRRMEWEEEEEGGFYTLEDVLRAAGVKL